MSQPSGYDVLASIDNSANGTSLPKDSTSHYIDAMEQNNDELQGQPLSVADRMVTTIPPASSAPTSFPYQWSKRYRDDDEEAQYMLVQDPFQDELDNAPKSTRNRSGSASAPTDGLLLLHTQKRPRRSRSVISFGPINDTVSRWTNSITKWTSTSKTIQGIPYEIQYSVFKPPRGVNPLKSLPKDGFIHMGPMTKSHFDSTFADAINAIKHGIKPKRISAGSSGSYFIYSTNGEIVGVFKPKDEEPYGPLSPKWTKWLHRNLFPCFFGRSCLIPNLGYICESAASLLDKQLQSHIVPYTDIVPISSDSFYYSFWEKRSSKPLREKVGSFQLFLNGYEEADKFLNKYPLPGSGWTLPFQNGSTNVSSQQYCDSAEPVFSWTPETILQFREELEKLVILDYIMRNTDRGLDNWMIRLSWETDDHGFKMPKLKVGAIDSGLAWPWKHPDEWRSYPFGWLFLPVNVIGQPFSEKTRRHYLPLLTSTAWWEECSLMFREMFAKDDDFKERMWKKQWAVMKGQAFNIVETLKNPTQGPLELARRTRILVWDEIMEVPVHIPVAVVENAIETSILCQSSRPLNTITENAGNKFVEDEEDDAEIGQVNLLKSPTRREADSGLVFAQDSIASKKVIIERLQMVTSKPPVFTWC